MQLLADFVLVSGFAINSVLLVVLVISKKRELPQKILMAILTLILVIVITLYASLHGLKPLFIFANLFEDGARFLIGPLLYLYIKSIFNRDDDFIKKHLAHFLPFILYWSFFTVPVVLSRYSGSPVFDYLKVFYGTGYLAVIKDVYVTIYIVLSIRLFLRFKTAIKSNYSSFGNANYGWLRKFLVGFLLATLFDVAVAISYVVYKPSVNWDLGIVSAMFLILVTFYLGYHGLKQSIIHLPEFLIEKGRGNKKNGMNNPQLAEEESKSLQLKLKEVLFQDKPYLFPELTLSGLAEQIGTTDRKLSILLNQNMNISFYDLINKYRVETVMEKLRSEEYLKFSMVGLAFDSGFNSKSSFYRSFKKETGLSPAEYRNEILRKNSPNTSSDTITEG